MVIKTGTNEMVVKGDLFNYYLICDKMIAITAVTKFIGKCLMFHLTLLLILKLTCVQLSSVSELAQASPQEVYLCYSEVSLLHEPV